jgi:hypothetical protein
MFTIPYLLENSHLPGPRGNLQLLHAFASQADSDSSRKCLAYIHPDTANSPEEFVGMCGIVGHAIANRTDVPGVLAHLRPYASHASWRIREAVAIGIQEMFALEGRLDLDALTSWVDGTALEQRAVVAALCEPKLLRDAKTNIAVLEVLRKFTAGFDRLDKIDDDQKVLRQALGYGWSVAIAAQPEEGRKRFQSFLKRSNKHIAWILRENLKKNRLIRMDAGWVEKTKAALG